jgi:hypothetical protein
VRDLVVQLEGGRAAYEPGDVLEGSASWDLGFAPAGLEVRLYWKTSGKGTTDVAIVEVVHLSAGAARGRQPFRFRLPQQPYSFSGRLIALTWGIEVVVEPGRSSQHLELVMAPGRRAVILHSADGPG